LTTGVSSSLDIEPISKEPVPVGSADEPRRRT
jgi:hypothetical protein